MAFGIRFREQLPRSGSRLAQLRFGSTSSSAAASVFWWLAGAGVHRSCSAVSCSTATPFLWV